MKQIFIILGILILMGGVFAVGISVLNARTLNLDLDINDTELTQLADVKGFSKTDFKNSFNYWADCECLDLKGDTCYEYGKCFVYMNSTQFQNRLAGYFIGKYAFGNSTEQDYNDIILKQVLQTGYDVWLLNELQRITEPTIVPVVKGDII